MGVLSEVLENLNTWIVVLATGVIVYTIRTILPKKITSRHSFGVAIRIIPLFIGAGLALIPGLRPFPQDLVESGAIGFISGSMASQVYSIIRRIMVARISGKAEDLGKPSTIPPDPK